MSRPQDAMFASIYQRCLLTRRSTPKHKDQSLTLSAQRTDNSIRKRFPSVSAMTESLMLTHTQTGVQQEHALLGPSGKITALRHRGTRLSLYLLKDIHQGRRELHAVIHAEAQTVCLTGLVVRVLP